MIKVTAEQIQKWRETKAQLNYWKTEELNLRNEICYAIFEGAVGWFSVLFEIDDIELKANSKLKYKVDSAVLKGLQDAKQLTQDDVDCFKPKVELIESKIKKLSETSMMWTAIESSPATPELKVKG